MRLSKEQRHIWKEWVSKPPINPDDEELWWVISTLLADLEEAEAKIIQLEIATVNRSVSNKEAAALFALGAAQEENAAMRKQLVEAQENKYG